MTITVPCQPLTSELVLGLWAEGGLLGVLQQPKRGS